MKRDTWPSNPLSLKGRPITLTLTYGTLNATPPKAKIIEVWGQPRGASDEPEMLIWKTDAGMAVRKASLRKLGVLKGFFVTRIVTQAGGGAPKDQ